MGPGLRAAFENAILGAAMAFDADAGFRPHDAIGDIGASVGRSRIEPEGLIHQDMEAAIAAHENGEFVGTGSCRGGGDIQNPAGVFEESLHSKVLSTRLTGVRVFFRTATSVESP